MADQSTSIAGSGYGNAYIDSLLWGCGWVNVSPASPIRYWFGTGVVSAADSSVDGGFTGIAWSSAAQDAVRTVLASYEAVCGLVFDEAPTAADADIVWWLAPDSAMPGYLGLHEVPDESWQPIYGYFNADDSTWQYLDQGGYGYVTILHEIGHGLCLAHPHDGGSERDATKFPGVRSAFGSYGKYSLNQGIYTTMSYNDGWISEMSASDAYGWQGTPMALDIAALQAIYGANMSTATGDDVYGLPDSNEAGTFWQCIWDASGIDTLSNEGATSGATINLNAATLVGASAGGMVSWVRGIKGGFTIANGVVIENAIGGDGSDTLVGNAADNQLTGGAGRDALTGGAGADTFIFDDGDSLAGSAARDTVRDFKISQGDLLDLALIDANASTPADDAFTYIASSGFGGVAGELRFSRGLLQGDTDGDAVADFELALTGVRSIDPAFVLL